jgi:hypothetical protein
MRKCERAPSKWRQPLLLFLVGLAFLIVGIVLTLIPFIAVGTLLVVMAAMAAFLTPLPRRG